MASSIVGSLAWGDLRGSAMSSICCSVSAHEPEPPELEVGGQDRPLAAHHLRLAVDFAVTDRRAR
jgi:hypothetical protein